MSLSQREQILIGVMVTLLVSFLVVLLIKNVDTGGVNLEEELAEAQQQLTRVQVLKQEWERVQKLPQPEMLTKSLTAFIEKQSSSLKVQDRLQLNAIKTALPEGMEALQVQYTKLNLDEAIEILHRLEHNKPILLIKEMEIKVMQGERLLTLSFRIYKQRPIG